MPFSFCFIEATNHCGFDIGNDKKERTKMNEMVEEEDLSRRVY
jgi:hypothetical protein